MKRLMAMLATLALVAAALTSCDKDDPKPKPLDPSYLPGKAFRYEKKVGDDTKTFYISFESGTERKFRGTKKHSFNKPGAGLDELIEDYNGIYTIQGNKITTKLRRHVRTKRVFEGGDWRQEFFTYEAGQEPILFEAEVNAQAGTITLRAWDQTIVLKLAPTPA